MNLLMISGKSAADTARGKKNAFYNTLEELHNYFDRIDVMCSMTATLFGNVFFHSQPTVRPDIMTVHEYAPFSNGRKARAIAKQYDTPMIFEIMHIPGMPRAGSWKERVARFMTRLYIKRDLRNAAAVRVINKQVGARINDRGVPQEKIKLVPAFYIDLDIFKPMNLEKKYDMIYVGRRAKNKGIELFEEAVRKLKIQMPNAKALIVDGWAKDSAEIAMLMNQSRMLIMPSYNEGGPRVVLEALACGMPVLATPVGIVPEVVSQEFIIPWSARKIHKKIQAILDDKIHFVKPDLSRFEKKSAIKAYAEFINYYAKSR